MNVPVALLILGGGALLVWSGIIDPPKGVAGLLGPILRGEAPPTSSHAPATRESLTGYAEELGAGLAAAGIGIATGGAVAGGKGNAIVAEGRKQLGKPYQWAGNGPARFDCSGLTLWCYSHAAGIKIPRVAEAQRRAGKKTSHPVPGDLVFFGLPAHHVGIYIGGGQHLHAPHTGDVVKISSVAGTRQHGEPVEYRTWLSAPAPKPAPRKTMEM